MELFWIGIFVGYCIGLLVMYGVNYFIKFKNRRLKRRFNKQSLNTHHHSFEVGDTVYMDYHYQTEPISGELKVSNNIGCKVIEVMWPSGLNEDGKYQEACYKVKPFYLPYDSVTRENDIKEMIRYEHNLQKYKATWQ